MTDGGTDKPQEPFDVHFRKVRPCDGKRGRTCTVRWTVAGITHAGTFKAQALAHGHLAELRACPHNGVALDVTTGLPVPEVRQARAEAAKAAELSWYQHALNHVARRRTARARNSMRRSRTPWPPSLQSSLLPGQRRPGRQAGPGGAVLPGVQKAGTIRPRKIAEVQRQVADHSRPLADLVTRT